MHPVIKFGSGLRAPATVWVVALLSSTAMATPTTVNVDQFAVQLNTPLIFNDSFNSNTSLVGGTGALQPASVTFSDGTTANYFVHGTIPQTTANNGQATLNTANGTIQSQPPPFLAKISTNGAFLQTGTTGAHALTPTPGFVIYGLFDLAVPTTPLGTYNIVLTNRTTANSQMGNVLELRVRDCVAGQGLCGALSGPVLQFVWSDYVNNTNALISEVTITPAEVTGNTQLLLEFIKNGGTDQISADYSFGAGNTLGTFVGTPLASLGTTSAATDVFTATNQFVLPGFEAFDPVPEPPSLLLLFSGLLGLAGLAEWRRQSAFARASERR